MINLESKCPLKSEDGRCKSPYREKGIPEECDTDNFSSCIVYLVYQERERFRRVQADNAKYFPRMRG